MENQTIPCKALVLAGGGPFIAKLGITAGANIDTILQSGPVLLLHPHYH